jgi:soluble lytic murein transglycosylase-like protein
MSRVAIKGAIGALALSASCASAQAGPRWEAPGAARFDAPIERLSQTHGVPERLIRRVIMRESRYAPHLTNRGHYGLMQIKLQTAHGMGYRGGAGGLLDGETNLTYAVPYLANAYVAAGKNEDRAVQLYAGGYYYVAKSQGLLRKLRTANSAPLVEDQTIAYAQTPAPQAQDPSPFATLFGGAAAPQPQAASEDAPEAPEFEMTRIPLKFASAPQPPRRPDDF